MKRKMTLAGGLLGLIGGFGAIIGAVVGFLSIAAAVAAVMQEAAASGTPVDAEGMAVIITSAVLIAVPLVFVVVSAILNIVSMVAWKKAPETYKKFKGTIIAAIIFNFISVVCSCIIGGFVGYFAMFPIITGTVLLIVDLALEGKRVAAANREEVKIVEKAE